MQAKTSLQRSKQTGVDPCGNSRISLGKDLAGRTAQLEVCQLAMGRTCSDISTKDILLNWQKEILTVEQNRVRTP